MSASALVKEVWAWFAVTLLVVVVRVVSRRMLHGSFKKLGIDDYLMLFCVVFYSVLTVGVHILSQTPTNLINPADHIKLTPDEINKRIYGSKIVLVVEQMQLSMIWGLKACLLIMYNRLTMSLKQNMMVKVTAVYVGLTFVVMETLWFGVWCRPFWHYWEVPPDTIQCTAETNHLITNAIFNISSDLMIILLPMPVFKQAQLPKKKKLVLYGVFALGTFTIVCAILSKYYSFSRTYGTEWIFWYIREASTAIIVANLPFTWTLLQKVFSLCPFLSKPTSPRPDVPTNNRFKTACGNLSNHLKSPVSRRGKDDEDGILTTTESLEQINRTYGIPLRIYRKDEVMVTSEPVRADNGNSFTLPQMSGPTVAQATANLGDHHERHLGNFTTIEHGI